MTQVRDLARRADCPVLVVDDEPDVREVLQRQLERAGYPVRVAAGADEALEVAAEYHPALVLLDIKMPGRSGVEALEDLLAQDPDVAVVMVSGQGSLETAIETLNKGATDYVTKPFNMDELLRRVEAALERRALILERRDYQRNLEHTVAERTEDLHQRVRELTALNRLFQQYLTQRDDYETEFIRTAESVYAVAERLKALAERMQERRAEMLSLARQMASASEQAAPPDAA